MLVLSRKVGQEVVIAGNIKVVISRIAGSRVTIGVEAPDSVHIVRGELDPMDESVRDLAVAPALVPPRPLAPPNARNLAAWVASRSR